MPGNFVLTSRILKALLRKSNAMRLSQLRSLPPAPDRVVFLGDAMAHGGVWNEWFPRLPTANNGMNASTVRDTLDRLDTITTPRAAVVMVGYGDLTGMGRSRKPDIIAAQVRELLERLRDRFPATPVLVTSVQPDQRRSHAYAAQQLNTRLQDLTAQTGATYVDVWRVLAAADGTLRPQFAGRGLNGAGYQSIAAVLAPHLAALKEASA